MIATEGDGARTNWRAFGERIGFGGNQVTQLYFSLQFGRHVIADQAEKELARLGLPRLGPPECLDATARLLESDIAFWMPPACS